MIYYKENDARRFRDTSRYLPKGVHLNIIDYKRMREVDQFYLKCQEHRDFYKDRSGRLKRVFEENSELRILGRFPTLTNKRCDL